MISKLILFSTLASASAAIWHAFGPMTPAALQTQLLAIMAWLAIIPEINKTLGYAAFSIAELIVGIWLAYKFIHHILNFLKERK